MEIMMKLMLNLNSKLHKKTSETMDQRFLIIFCFSP